MESIENHKYDYQAWKKERIRTHMNQISMEKRRADIIILKIMKMEHTDENIYYIGNIANSLLKIIRNEE